MRLLRSLLFAMTSTVSGVLFAQYTPPDPTGLEGIIVETYYVADSNDAGDTDGCSTFELDPGDVTYRVFADLKEGYKLLTVGGFPDHDLTFSTSTTFFYNDDRGDTWGGDINTTHLDENTVAIDSWLSMGAASDTQWGVPKTEDGDGSIVGGANNDGGSNSVPGGLLVNDVPVIGVPLTTADGLIPAVTLPGIVAVGTGPTMFDSPGTNSFSSQDFAWAVLGGTEGPTPENKILIGQFTTDGIFSFCLNLWVKIPDSLVCSDPNCHEILEFYGNLLVSDTAGGGFNTDNKFTHPTLCFTSTPPEVDCLGIPGGSALPGTPCDDGNTATTNDTWSSGCLCEGVVGINEESLDASVGVYPNPARDIAWVEITGQGGSQASYELKDALGQLIAVKDLGLLSDRWTGSLDMAGLPSGVYFLVLTIGSQRHMERLTTY